MLNRNVWLVGLVVVPAALAALAVLLGLCSESPATRSAAGRANGPAGAGETGATAAGGRRRLAPAESLRRVPAGALELRVQFVPARGARQWRVVQGGARPVELASGAGDVVTTIARPRAGTAMRAESEGHVGVVHARFGEDRELHALEVTFYAGARLTGTVSGPQGPLTGAIVTVAAQPADESQRALAAAAGGASRQEVHTGVAGEFVFAGLPPRVRLELRAAHPHGVPDQVVVVPLEPGGERRIDMDLRSGSALTGRLQSLAGEPLAGVPLFVQRVETAGGVTHYEHEVRLQTERDGSFRTPALPPRELRVLKCVTRGEDDVVRVVQWSGETPAAGATRDLGVLRPAPCTVTLRLPRGDRGDGGAVTVIGLGGGPRVGLVGLAALPLGRGGQLVIEGLPPGECTYSLLASSGEALLSDRFTARAPSVTIDVPWPRAADVAPVPLGRLLVRAERVPGRTLDVVVATPDGVFVTDATLPVRDGGAEGELELPSGSYLVVARSGARVSEPSDEIEVPEGGDAHVSLRAWDTGQIVTLNVRDDGVPAAGVRVVLRGFTERGRAMRRELGRTDADGRLLVTAVPVSARGLRLALFHGTTGRQVFVRSADFDDATIDLHRHEH